MTRYKIGPVVPSVWAGLYGSLPLVYLPAISAGAAYGQTPVKPVTEYMTHVLLRPLVVQHVIAEEVRRLDAIACQRSVALYETLEQTPVMTTSTTEEV